MMAADDVTFIHTVAQQLRDVVIAHATPGRWRAGDGSSTASWSTLRTFVDGHDQPFHLGTAIEKPNQRAMMAGQPLALDKLADVFAAVDTDTPDALGAELLELSRRLNTFMNLKVDTAPSMQ
ncbi:hypothetical protein [Gordonia otitidis]|uniref:Uncharacterized protein n=1 Tax=Gordonia otitidis (strain DSM 44809 / CCUG 52243 / JCM 12355 / NBRC 100426 / IFM 10032) TaxID=1108044 RepID=H5TIK6_GORO1|nr:hypothetical protein [Gordonia otitidis]GAB33314.1 hypothetical protein GOOTI_062_00070 [Gordonia otitidis NBRC 100426]